MINMIERRSLLGLIGVAIAAPAIVRATSLMKIAPVRRLPHDQVSMRWLENYHFDADGYNRVDVLFGSLRTRPDWRVFNHDNLFLKNIDEQYQAEFGAEGAKIGSQLRIRLPKDYTVVDGPGLSIQEPSYTELYPTWYSPPVIPDSLTLAAAAVALAPAVLKTPVTRRFWSK